MVLNYKAVWGKEVSYGHTISTVRVGAIKVQLAHVMELDTHMGKELTDVIDMMSLEINDNETEDSECVGNEMTLGAHGDNIFPNIVGIRIHGREPPNLSLPEIEKLRDDCEKAVIKINCEPPEYPCVVGIQDSKQ